MDPIEDMAEKKILPPALTEPLFMRDGKNMASEITI